MITIPKYVNSPKFERIALKILKLYKINSLVTLLHPILEDKNFDDFTINWCMRKIEPNKFTLGITQEEKDLSFEICELLLQLKESQRIWINYKVKELKGGKIKC